MYNHGLSGLPRNQETSDRSSEVPHAETDAKPASREAPPMLLKQCSMPLCGSTTHLLSCLLQAGKTVQQIPRSVDFWTASKPHQCWNHEPFVDHSVIRSYVICWYIQKRRKLFCRNNATFVLNVLANLCPKTVSLHSTALRDPSRYAGTSSHALAFLSQIADVWSRHKPTIITEFF